MGHGPGATSKGTAVRRKNPRTRGQRFPYYAEMIVPWSGREIWQAQRGHLTLDNAVQFALSHLKHKPYLRWRVRCGRQVAWTSESKYQRGYKYEAS